MALTTKLVMRQSQSLVMTPQLLQAIKLLQFSNLELTAYIEQELERNPLLERAEEGAFQDADFAATGHDAPPEGDLSEAAGSGWSSVTTDRGGLATSLGPESNGFSDDRQLSEESNL